MPEYKVTAVKTDTFEIVVDAESNDEAIQIAQDTELDWNNYSFIDSDITYTTN